MSMESGRSGRCFICGATMLAPSRRRLADPRGRERAFPVACGSCGVLTEQDTDPAECWRDLSGRLAQPTFVADPDAAYGLDLYTLRTAATRLGRGIRPRGHEDRAALLAPHGRRAPEAELYDLADGSPVSLCLLCRPSELDGIRATLAPHARWTDDVVILLDDDVALPRTMAVEGFAPGAVRVASRPLAGDFAAQRNALQHLARHAWLLQLDADESLAPEAGSLLPALAALADAGGVVSIGLPRRNRVDGVLSDVYPDVQYRLNRKSVRYAGRVHERPVLVGGWQRSFIALHGAIEHALSLAHVLARSRLYETLDPGHGRIEEEEALLRPYRA